MTNTSIKFDGKAYRVFTVKAFGRTIDVIIVPSSYLMTGSLALQVFEVQDGQVTDEFGILTSNLSVPGLDLQHAFIKTYSENEGWALELARKIGTDTGRRVSSGYATFPLFRFDTDKCLAPENQ